jgi:hypothetical protein
MRQVAYTRRVVKDRPAPTEGPRRGATLPMGGELAFYRAGGDLRYCAARLFWPTLPMGGSIRLYTKILAMRSCALSSVIGRSADDL